MFKDFKKSISDRLDFLIENSNTLYQVDIDKNEMWDLYLDSFPPGTNEIYRERRAYDCSCCRNFIKHYGNIVGIIDNKKVSIWDIEPNENHHKVVADVMRDKINSLPVTNTFYTKFGKLGTDNNRELTEKGEVLVWEHFYYKLPNTFVSDSNSSIESLMGSNKQTKEVIERSFKELTSESLDVVLELITNKTLYRGEEHSSAIENFKKYKNKYDTLVTDEERNNFCWELSVSQGRYLAIRNTSIGVLLTNISEGVNIEIAVKKYEDIVAPSNYKRPKAIYTESMVKRALEKLKELGLENSLARKYAKIEDISIKNVLWASGESKELMKNVFDDLLNDIKVSPKSFKNVKEVSIDKFVEDILPDAETIELLLDNKLNNNLVSLIGPEDTNSPSIFKWDNNFSWSYNGDFTDSIKESVKKRGGNVEGDLRASLSWAEGNDSDDNSDLDIHCDYPGGHIYFGAKNDFKSGGNLDVDIISPSEYKNKDIVENITFPDKQKMRVGEYTFYIKNYSLRGSQKGFTVEIEFDGEIHNFEYDKPLINNENVDVVTLVFDGKSFKIKKSLPSTKKSKEMWGLSSMKFIPVSTFMYSPNHWDDKGVGNRHYLFMLEGCTNEGNARGLYNEFLKSDLEPHRKVFEALGSKMRVAHSDNQLSGVGFSSTTDNVVTLKVNGKIMNINFNTNKDGKYFSKSSEKEVSL